MIDVRRLQLLQALGRHQTVAAAADALGVTPSAVSQQLTALAKDAGVALVERQGRRFILTGAARLLVERADVIFAEMERAEADLAEYAQGRVGSARVGSFATGICDLVAPAVAALRTTRPGWRFEIVQAEPDRSTEMLRSGELDIAVTMSSDIPPNATGEFRLAPVMVEPFDVVLPYQHPLAACTDLELGADLADAHWIMSPPGSPWYDCVAAACHQAGFQPQVAHTVHEFSAVFALVRAGLGVALMPRLGWTGMPAPHVVVRTVRNTARRHVVVVTRAGYDAEPLLSAVREAASKVPVPAASPLLVSGGGAA
ncbi:LysR family transcriptional regulator [Streptomonospora salina]|uniref:DNA-binding transcriptional LysR family regulator n=1 Tax=Streptomonospora salina TaxID=104205 RepID=A0A841EFM2_9ACTN|nr:LysR family transcriptional regulator [Streptomonospora salina]MBB6001104.1 DNA-binding transcriptional LysR family regulator [Streptomonospora salina]